MFERLQVIVAEDYLPLRLCVCELLSTMGVTVIECGDGNELWQRLEEQRVDLVITDIRMGGASGVDVLRRRRASGDRTPFVLMSGAMAGVGEKVAGCEPVVLLEKPFTEDTLRAALQQAMALRAA